jgi:hypothetical protein
MSTSLTSLSSSATSVPTESNLSRHWGTIFPSHVAQIFVVLSYFIVITRKFIATPRRAWDLTLMIDSNNYYGLSQGTSNDQRLAGISLGKGRCYSMSALELDLLVYQWCIGYGSWS